MPDREVDLVARLEALGERAGAAVPAMPAALRGAVAARGGEGAAVVVPQRVPRAALAAAAAVIVAGVSVVAVRVQPVVRESVRGWAPGGATMLAMTERFNRGASIDAAVGGAAGGGVEGAGPVYRALDARSGLLPE